MQTQIAPCVTKRQRQRITYLSLEVGLVGLLKLGKLCLHFQRVGVFRRLVGTSQELAAGTIESMLQHASNACIPDTLEGAQCKGLQPLRVDVLPCGTTRQE